MLALALDDKYAEPMTFANVGTLGTVPGKRDQLVAILTRPDDELKAPGACCTR